MPSCSLGDSTHTSRRACCDEHKDQQDLAWHCRVQKKMLFCTQLHHKFWLSGENKVPCIQQIKRECPQAHCVTFSIRDFSKPVIFSKEVGWAELPPHKHLRIGLFGFGGGWVFLLHRNHSQSYYSKLFVKYRVLTAQIWGQLLLFLNSPLLI